MSLISDALKKAQSQRREAPPGQAGPGGPARTEDRGVSPRRLLPVLAAVLFLFAATILLLKVFAPAPTRLSDQPPAVLRGPTPPGNEGAVAPAPIAAAKQAEGPSPVISAPRPPTPAEWGTVAPPAPGTPRAFPRRSPPLPQDREPAPPPAGAPSLTDQGYRQLAAGDGLGAAETFRQSLQRTPAAETFAGMVRALRTAGTPELARQYLKDGLSAFPTDPGLLRQGVALALASDEEIPLADLAGRLAELTPHDPWAWTALGIGQLRQNRPADALPGFTRSLELAPSAVENLYYQGLCHDRLGDYDRALACYRRFLAGAGDHHPEHRRWLEGRVALLERAGRR